MAHTLYQLLGTTKIQSTFMQCNSTMDQKVCNLKHLILLDIEYRFDDDRRAMSYHWPKDYSDYALVYSCGGGNENYFSTYDMNEG